MAARRKVGAATYKRENDPGKLALRKAETIGPDDSPLMDPALKDPMLEAGLDPQELIRVLGAIGPDNGMAAVAKIPPRIAKETGRMLVDRIKQKAPGLGDIWEDLYQMYPRLVGHVDDVRPVDVDSPTRGGNKTYGLRESRDIDMKYDDASIMEEAAATREAYGNPDNWPVHPRQDDNFMRMGSIYVNPKHMGAGAEYTPAEVSAHELTHAAQHLGVPDFANAYPRETLSKGYYNNKYEVGARNAGERFSKLRAAKEPGENIKDTRVRLRKATKEASDPGWIAQLRKFFSVDDFGK